MFVQRGPFDWTKLHFAVWRNDLTAVKEFVEVRKTFVMEKIPSWRWH